MHRHIAQDSNIYIHVDTNLYDEKANITNFIAFRNLILLIIFLWALTSVSLCICIMYQLRIVSEAYIHVLNFNQLLPDTYIYCIFFVLDDKLVYCYIDIALDIFEYSVSVRHFAKCIVKRSLKHVAVD